ncbi:MAG: IS1634 family transposase [Brevundimonas sp.]|uniref:IS1634 family transposase n=1 Tax=Brevundimonas sp. TaxID=1871086 RepID=UPI00273730E0|nr:IS1634 family transposase [Brevundimonas sp.]MDP3404386.1 IS1634 family transposase [Brevundimonas sp.]
MYLRTIQRRNKDGSTVRYVQLAHNVRHPGSGNSVAKVLHSFGREDALDRDGLERLVGSISRYLGIAGPASADGDGEGLSVVSSKRLGGAWALDGLWRRVGIDQMMTRLAGGRRFGTDMERVLFALVANRALEPSSKLAATTWLAERVAIDGLEVMDADAAYRAMDWLLEIEADLAEAVYWSVADLLNLEVDLLFFDTTSTYFETEQADEPAEGATVGFRTWGKSKDHRDDLPQVVIGMAVTRTGIPIRVWSWPGNTGDQGLIRQVKDDLRAWKLGRVVWVADRGFSSAQNRRYLQRAGGNYIIGEKLRGDSAEAAAALSRQGRYRKVAGNLEVKEVVIDDGTMRDRFVICRNPEAVERDRTVRDQLLAQLADAIDGTDTHDPHDRAALAAKLPAGLRRFLRTTPTGLLRIDRAKVAAEENLDGKFLLRTSDPTLSAEDVAVGYKQLLEVERGWRDMKSTLELRPVFHRLEDRIHAHILLCWLALLLIRIAETETGDTWRNLRNTLDQIHLVELAGTTGRVLQRSELTSTHTRILAALGVPEPPRFAHVTPA